jgi:hypothetical protein
LLPSSGKFYTDTSTFQDSHVCTKVTNMIFSGTSFLKIVQI